MLDLSVQQVIDCSGKYGNDGCEGGLMHNAYKYIQDAGGIIQEHDYPYEAKIQECRKKRSNPFQVRVRKHVMMPQGDENALADAVATIGPVSVAFDASTRGFMMYGGGSMYRFY